MEPPTGLTVEQKAALCLGSDFWHTAPVPEHGIEAILVSDGPHGLRRQPEQGDHIGLSGSVPATCFPTASALGSSWDVELAREVGAAIGLEAREQGVAVVLGPGVNIKRSPLCGRNFEYLSEDPLLTGHLGAALVEGLQSQHVGASVKHFAANNQETDRLRVSADVDERTLREIYLPAFEHVVTTARPWTVMCAYNKLNGEFASQHRWLLTDVLRGEWGFDGLVVSDWGAVHDRVAALVAGLDLEMPPNLGVSDRTIVAAVADGSLDESVLDTAVGRVLGLVGRARERQPAPSLPPERHVVPLPVERGQLRGPHERRPARLHVQDRRGRAEHGAGLPLPQRERQGSPLDADPGRVHPRRLHHRRHAGLRHPALISRAPPLDSAQN